MSPLEYNDSDFNWDGWPSEKADKEDDPVGVEIPVPDEPDADWCAMLTEAYGLKDPQLDGFYGIFTARYAIKPDDYRILFFEEPIDIEGTFVSAQIIEALDSDEQEVHLELIAAQARENMEEDITQNVEDKIIIPLWPKEDNPFYLYQE